MTQYQHGYPLANIAHAFYSSTEAVGWLSSYVDTHTGSTLDASPSGSEADFVNWAYDHILDRGPGGRSVSYWVGLLNGGGWSRAQVIAFFSEHSSARANPDMESSTAPVAPTASTTDIPVDYTYTWDDVGNLTSLRETSYALDQTQCYGYDNLHRLTDGYTRSDGNCAGGYQAVGPDPYNVDYSYDSIGNITAATGTNTPGGGYSYAGSGGPHAVNTAGSGYSFGYDNAGNMTSRVTPSGTQTLTYDTQNRLVGISGAGPDLDALYDAHGVRVKRTLGSDVTYYLTDGYETDGASSDTVHHTIGGTNVGATVNGVLHVGASDHLGSGNFTRSESGAAARNRYQPYGQRRGASANTLPTDITFTGQTDDRGTGLIDYNARHYDPIVGRFIMADPVLGGPDRYTYVQGRPTILTDPSGHLPGQGSGSQSDQVAYLNKVTKHCLQNGDGAGTSGTARQNGCFGSRTLRTRGYLGPDEANSGCLASGGRTGCRGDEARVHADLLCSANGLSCSDFGDGIQWEVGLKVFNRTILRTDFLVYDASDGEWVLFELKVADGLRETAQQAVAGKIQVEAYEDLLNAIGVPTRLGSADDFEEIFGGSRWAELFGVTGVQSHGRATVLATDGVILAISERTGRPPSVPLPVGLLEEVPDVAATFGAAIAGLGAIGLLYGGPHGQPR